MADEQNPFPPRRCSRPAGLVTVFHYSYLISITDRQQVAQIRGLPVYVVTDVALTPCTSQHDAAQAVAKTAAALRSSSGRTAAAADDDDDSDDGSDSSASGGEDETPSLGPDTTGGGSGGGSYEVVDDGVEPASEIGGPVEDGAGGAAARPRSSVLKDVIGRRGSYGRFAQRWFSRAGWAMGQKRMLGLSAEQMGDGGGAAGVGKGVPTRSSNPSDAGGSEAAISLLPKLLRTSQMLFGSSKTFFFSYDYDITRSMLNPKVPATPLVPLYDHVDPTYFWNRHIIQPFIDAGVDSLALPLMQGFVGQKTFVVDSHPPQVDEGANKNSFELSNFTLSRAASPSPSDNNNNNNSKATTELRPTEKRFDITVISRRSTKRAGLRYLRRGIDEEGNVANAVETEQILSPADATGDPSARVYSFVQTRGSFPLFFTQSPYSLKPAPVMQHSPDANFAALTKHFEDLRRRYGSVQVVNLVEKHGVEAPIAELYQRSIQRLNEEEEKKKKEEEEEEGKEESGPETDRIGFEWFDFHDVCRGMKFENVSLLLQILGDKLESFGSSVSVGDQVVARQKGVLRTNCMDCLDRTNVCQSSFAKYMLDLQLRELGFDMSAQVDQENTWFNTLWADNGDAVSKQYASTAAMKGDYTRTRKRDYRGALTDAGLSLTRLFNG